MGRERDGVISRGEFALLTLLSTGDAVLLYVHLEMHTCTLNLEMYTYI